MLVISDLICDK